MVGWVYLETDMLAQLLVTDVMDLTSSSIVRERQLVKRAKELELELELVHEPASPSTFAEVSLGPLRMETWPMGQQSNGGCPFPPFMSLLPLQIH
jgi:hypothetical protein